MSPGWASLSWHSLGSRSFGFEGERDAEREACDAPCARCCATEERRVAIREIARRVGMSDALIRLPIMNYVVGNPMDVVLVQSLEGWLIGVTAGIAIALLVP